MTALSHDRLKLPIVADLPKIDACTLPTGRRGFAKMHYAAILW